MMGTWPDKVQGFGRALHFPWFQLKQASVQVHFPTSHHVALAHLVWIKLEHLKPTKASGEGIAVWEDDQERGGSQAEVPLKAVASLLSLERPGKAGVCKCVLSLSPVPGPHPGIQSISAPKEEPVHGRASGPARGPALAWSGMKQYQKPSWRRLFEAYFFLS